MPTPRPRSSPTYLAHRRWSETEARQALAAWDQSGLELTAFAIRARLDPQRLSRWRRRLASSGAPTFEEILPQVSSAPLDEDPAAGGRQDGFEIVLACGRIVRVPASFDARALRRLLAVVEEVRAC